MRVRRCSTRGPGVCETPPGAQGVGIARGGPRARPTAYLRDFGQHTQRILVSLRPFIREMEKGVCLLLERCVGRTNEVLEGQVPALQHRAGVRGGGRLVVTEFRMEPHFAIAECVAGN